MEDRAKHIETLRGITILFVVIGHVIGSAPEGGMKIDFPSCWRYLYLWIDYIQMPLFTGIAGWVYALKPTIKNGFGSFAYKKAIRLLIPMATVGTFYFLTQYFIPGTNMKGDLSAIWKIYLFPYTIYWYLPSLFLIFLMMYVVDKYRLCQTPVKWFLLFIVTWGASLIVKTLLPPSVPNLLSFKGAIEQFPYFVVGVGIQRFTEVLNKIKKQKVYAVLAVIGLILLQYKWNCQINYTTPIEWYIYFLPLWVSATLMLLLHQTRSNRFFVWLGSYAYIIYLFHGFGTSGGRIILTRLGIQSDILIFVVTTCIALFSPVLVEKIANKWKVTRILFIGSK